MHQKTHHYLNIETILIIKKCLFLLFYQFIFVMSSLSDHDDDLDKIYRTENKIKLRFNKEKMAVSRLLQKISQMFEMSFTVLASEEKNHKDF